MSGKSSPTAASTGRISAAPCRSHRRPDCWRRLNVLTARGKSRSRAIRSRRRCGSGERRGPEPGVTGCRRSTKRMCGCKESQLPPASVFRLFSILYQQLTRQYIRCGRYPATLPLAEALRLESFFTGSASRPSRKGAWLRHRMHKQLILLNKTYRPTFWHGTCLMCGDDLCCELAREEVWDHVKQQDT